MDKLTGSVSLDGTISYTGLTPRFTAHGLDVYRLKELGDASIIENEGPHIFLQLPQLLLTSIPAESLAKGVEYLFAGPGIGSIRMLHGYAAADLGNATRRVEQYGLYVAVLPGALTVRIDGWAGPVDESIAHTGKAGRLRQDFQIKFLLPERLFEKVIQRKHQPEALRQLMNRALLASNA